MSDLQEFLWGFSIFSLLFCSLRGLTKALPMALSLYSPSSPVFPPPTSWVRHILLGTKTTSPLPDDSSAVLDAQENTLLPPNQTSQNRDDDKPQEEKKSLRDEKFKEGSDSSTMAKGSGAPNKLRKRPGRLVVPEYCPGLEFTKLRKKMENQEFQVQGRDYCLATKKGRRETLEDAYIVLLDVLGDSKQAFFAVVDGHGGRDAADYVVENLGKNIINALEKIAEDEENAIELAIRRGHGRTDEEFLSQGVGSGACAASVLVKDGELHVANVGDCRVVLSRNGVATALTKQHRVCREDERLRIEKSGGFVECKNGVWRVQGSLAVSRAIGDVHLKEWVISEPEIRRLPLTPDCEFLIMASDGLWDKVKDQEAVDEVMREMGRKDNDGMNACKRLMEMSFRRGNMDDVTVMVVHLQHFIISTI
ncbi:probable protein phosphatase 2C 30 [Cucurbita pepo subsp. pepo]|uniref:probable protein phosphatase 2C 30 n=1 Tax=Cucurbita pepo subsp. pepo TaxID=3664 RepID=UPI000C9D3DBE|nr:probable protein phosphatase 2C 30 [Cucurbita pepo subsp. pepo]